MGVSTSAHPCYQSFALPPYKDKQHYHPRQVIIYAAILNISKV